MPLKQYNADPASSASEMDSEYHRRRAELEADQALRAQTMVEATRHLELARIHRQKRDLLSVSWRHSANGGRPPICRTDKEG